MPALASYLAQLGCRRELRAANRAKSLLARTYEIDQLDRRLLGTGRIAVSPELSGEQTFLA